MPKSGMFLPNPADSKKMPTDGRLLDSKISRRTTWKLHSEFKMANRKQDLQASNRRMTELLKALTTGEGMRSSLLSGVKLMRADRAFPRTPVLYEPSIVIVGQGRKRGYL